MKSYLPIKYIWLLLAGMVLLLSSCKKEPDPIPNPNPDPDPDVPADIRVINNWIDEGMNNYYLWNTSMPDIDPNKEPDPEAYFYKLLDDDDRFSWIVDDYEALLAMFNGVELATGMAVMFGLITDTQVIGLVEYVTPDSPAADSGVARGDIILSIDGELLNKENYWELYNQTTSTFEFGKWNGEVVKSNGKKITLTAIELNQNPVVYHEVIEYQGFKIGYIVYTMFTAGQNNEWLDELNNVLGEFKAAGVSDLVMDLRYNPGGRMDVSAYLASTLGSASAMENGDVFLRMMWNDGLNQYWKQQDLDEDGKPDGDESSQLVVRLPHSDLNFNLSKVYFFTTDKTASASESLMIGLYPYTDVVQIGSATFGKFYGSVTIDDWENPKRHNWAMQPIVLKFTNADGYTDFVRGIPPDIFMEDKLLYAEPFGSLQDPFLSRALEEITGIAPGTRKSVRPEVRFTPLPRPGKQIPEIQLESSTIKSIQEAFQED